MAKSKYQNLKIPKNWINILTVLGILALLAFILRFRMVAEPVAKALNMDPGVLMGYADNAFFILLGIWLVSWGARLMMVPWLGLPVILVGIGLLAYSFYQIYNKNTLND